MFGERFDKLEAFGLESQPNVNDLAVIHSSLDFEVIILLVPGNMGRPYWRTHCDHGVLHQEILFSAAQ